MKMRHCVVLALLYAPPAQWRAGRSRFVPTKSSATPFPKSLTGARGDPERGRAIVVARESTCLLCHSGPFPEQRFQGDLSPSLKGTGARWSEGELRLRLVDASRLNPATIMPSYYRVEGLNRVAQN